MGVRAVPNGLHVHGPLTKPPGVCPVLVLPGLLSLALATDSRFDSVASCSWAYSGVHRRWPLESEGKARREGRAQPDKNLQSFQDFPASWLVEWLSHLCSISRPQKFKRS